MQQISGLGGGSGIVVVLITGGIFLEHLKIEPEAGHLAIWAGVLIGITYGVLGIYGILKR